MKRWIATLLVALLALMPVTALAANNAWDDISIDGTWTDRAAINGDVQAYYYRIELPEQGLLEIVLQSWMEGVEYKLWNEDVSHEYGSEYVLNGTESEAASMVVSSIYLPAGVYYAEVSQNSGYTGQFRIKATFTSGQCNESEPNDPASVATPLNAGETRRGMIWVDDEYDYYAFAIGDTQAVRIVVKAYMDGLEINLRDSDELEVLDADGKSVDSEYLLSGNTAEPSTCVIERTLKPGSYLVMVKKNSSYDGIYELTVNGDLIGSAPAAPDTGDVWYCPDCGTQNQGNFCYNCGAADPRQ